jgi:hypothetical protein
MKFQTEIYILVPIILRTSLGHAHSPIQSVQSSLFPDVKPDSKVYISPPYTAGSYNE